MLFCLAITSVGRRFVPAANTWLSEEATVGFHYPVSWLCEKIFDLARIWTLQYVRSLYITFFGKCITDSVYEIVYVVQHQNLHDPCGRSHNASERRTENADIIVFPTGNIHARLSTVVPSVPRPQLQGLWSSFVRSHSYCGVHHTTAVLGYPAYLSFRVTNSAVEGPDLLSALLYRVSAI